MKCFLMANRIEISQLDVKTLVQHDKAVYTFTYIYVHTRAIFVQQAFYDVILFHRLVIRE